MFLIKTSSELALQRLDKSGCVNTYLSVRYLYCAKLKECRGHKGGEVQRVGISSVRRVLREGAWVVGRAFHLSGVRSSVAYVGLTKFLVPQHHHPKTPGVTVYHCHNYLYCTRSPGPNISTSSTISSTNQN